MGRFFRLSRLVVLIVTLAIAIAPARSHANATKEFIMSATYGVLAGALVGAATLAFTPAPGDNLRNVAKGASLGLYAGLLLGAYVAYWIPSGQDDEDPAPAASLMNSAGATHWVLNDEVPAPSRSVANAPKAALIPLSSEQGIDGALLIIRPLTF